MAFVYSGTQAPPVRIRSQRVLTPDGIRPGTVVIEGGRIDSLAPIDAGHADWDVEDSLVMPALIDSHVHVNEPGRTEWEGWRTATQAAARGGVSILADMPLNSMPVTTTRDALAAKRASMDGKLWIDCALWGGVVPGNAAQLPGMVADGVAGVKAFLCHSGIDEFPAVDRADLQRVMPVLKGLGVPLLFHAELEADEPIDVSHHSVRNHCWLLQCIRLCFLCRVRPVSNVLMPCNLTNSWLHRHFHWPYIIRNNYRRWSLRSDCLERLRIHMLARQMHTVHTIHMVF